jgi:putative FmdB family regulatory protein
LLLVFRPLFALDSVSTLAVRLLIFLEVWYNSHGERPEVGALFAIQNFPAFHLNSEVLLMPTYEYECKECGGRFERFQKITDEPVSECEKCGGPVRRVLFPVGILFKGPGFYVTDYRKPSPESKEESPSGNGKKPSEAKD